MADDLATAKARLARHIAALVEQRANAVTYAAAIKELSEAYEALCRAEGRTGP